ncbi:hypothetical protein M3Y98_00922700 [Aphelenchoides besseyi]|nr:hypothetical protein M3Y98_00922700 [Aphelenchoides besseyi]KAI6194161.1 hypothetical protein M3Y96_01095300 [Aphelenchoides besseyi]
MNTSVLLIPFFVASLTIALPFQIRDPSRETTVEQPEETFRRVDSDNSGSLTFDEFLHTEKIYEQLKRDEFDGLDADHDGQITRHEYEVHYQKEKQSADDLRAEYFGQIFEQFDSDYDLRLNREEVQKVLAERFMLKPRENFNQIFDSFDKNHDGALDLEEYIKFDAELPFHELDPISAQQTSDDEEKDATSKPILAMKEDKLPMMKKKIDIE